MLADNQMSSRPGSLGRFLTLDSVPITCLAVVMSAFLWAILDPLLEPHLVMVGIHF